MFIYFFVPMFCRVSFCTSLALQVLELILETGARNYQMEKIKRSFTGTLGMKLSCDSNCYYWIPAFLLLKIIVEAVFFFLVQECYHLIADS